MKSNIPLEVKADIFEPIRIAIALGGEIPALPGNHAYQVSMTDSLSRTDYQYLGFCADYESARALAVNWIIENRLSVLQHWGWDKHGALTVTGLKNSKVKALDLKIENDFTAKINLDPISFSIREWIASHSDEEIFNIWQEVAEDQRDEIFMIEKVTIVSEKSEKIRADFSLRL